MAELDKGNKLLQQLTDCLKKNNLQQCNQILTQLKLVLIQLPSFRVKTTESPNLIQEVLFAKNVLQGNVLLTIKQQEDEAQETSFVQLHDFYIDNRSQKNLQFTDEDYYYLGLILLRYLVKNRISEFHSNLELLKQQDLQNQYIKLSVSLEQQLMQGTFYKMLKFLSSQQVDEYYQYFMKELEKTVREEIQSCCAVAYQELKINDAIKIMLLKSKSDLAENAKKNGWNLGNNVIRFPQEVQQDEEILPSKFIDENVQYARELEKIV